MCAELRRELVNTKKELAESRVRHEAKDVELGRKDEAFNQMHEEINEIRTNFQTRLENTEQELNRTQQDLSFAQSQIANNQVVDNRQMETSSNRENIYNSNQENRYQQNPRYGNYSRENVNDTVLPIVPMATHMPGPSVSVNRGAHRNTNNSDEPKFRIPYFNGKSKFEGFWTVFELGTKKFQWNSQAKLENLWCSLKDDALDFACKLSPDVQNNISQFRDALQRRYGDNRLPEQYREDLANIKKHFKETLPEYAARVENLVCRGYPHLKEINLLNTLKVENFLKGLPDQSIAYEVKIRKPQSIDDAIEWFNWHECCKGNIFKKRAEVRQIETEEQYDHTEFIEENEIRKVGNTRFVTEERGKTVDFNLTSSGNKRNTEVCRDIDIGKSKLSVAFEDTDKLYAVDNICGDEPDRSKLSVASDRVRAVTLRVPIVIEGDYLNAVIDTGAEVTVMSQEKFLKIPENRRPQIYKAERNLVVAEAGKKMQTLGMADVSCQIGPLDFIWSVYIAPIGDELLLGCDIIDEHDITINTKRGLEIKGQWINCDVTRRSDKVARVVLKEAVTIPANSEVILPGELHPVEQFEVFIDNNADVELYDSVLYKDFCIGMSQGDLIDTPVIPENWRSPKVLSTKTDSFEIEAEIPKLPDFLSELYQKSCEKISDQEQKLKLAKVLLKKSGCFCKR
ncbi:Hypothetical predicted protein [Mytilus galloprovincialis]|uniref:Peptidase A2 domain-containing protein n=1 Tax=Mytilus galloprovincialis TaxID=29158 RepID=A0A8B6FX88_MYTGA|nr:Hypothetical predicted protein [Mytilus galloprovincialis]